MIQTKKLNWADKIGAVSAFLCIIHCIAAPALLAMGVGFINNPLVASLFVLIAFISIYKTTKGKLLKGISIFLWASFLGFVLSIFFEERAAIFEYTMFLFSAFIILGHTYNMRYCLRNSN